ncbi:hypothetical protein D3C87_1582700 [compost metagenome]
MLRVQVLFEQVALVEADIAVVEVQHQLAGHADHFLGHATRIPQGFTGIDELVGERADFSRLAAFGRTGGDDCISRHGHVS